MNDAEKIAAFTALMEAYKKLDRPCYRVVAKQLERILKA